MRVAAGSRIGPYEVGVLIGAGGMGEVYRARDSKLNREVALKLLPDAFARDSERLARFRREAQTLAALNHPNIAAIYGLEENALVMELVEGETLRGPLPVPTALDYARQIAQALEAAHERGIVHRDLKPANIKVTPQGVVKVLDFGLAKAADAEPTGNPSESPTLTISPTRTGMILGTAAYMAPEQARGATVDKRADIWAFGVVLYEMLAGQPAFSGETVSDILAALLRAEPDWSALPAGAPPGVQRLLRRCLQRDRRQRLRDIGDARLELDEAPETAPLPAPARRSPWLPWAITAALAATLLAVALRREPSPLPRPVSRWSATLPVSEAASLELSRDGTRLVYGSGASTGLMVRMLDRPDAKRLTGALGAGPVFSPDGQWITYFAGGKLEKIPVTGGAAITICEAPGQRGRTWGDDDTIVWGTVDGGLMRVPAAGGAPHTLTAPDRKKGEVSHQWPYFLPGARAVVFTINTGGSYDAARIGVLDLETGSYRTIVDNGSNARYVPTGHLVYARSGTLFAAPFDSRRLVVTGPETPVIEDLGSNGLRIAQYTFSDSGLLLYLGSHGSPLPDRTIEWLDRHGVPKASTLPPRLYTGVRLSPDGRRVAATIASSGSGVLAIEQRGDIWIGELERGTLIRLTSEGSNFSPVWSPDGGRVTFGSNVAGNQLMYRIAADGSGKPELLLEGKAGAQWPMSWTPGGDLLLYRSPLESNMWLLPALASGAEAKPRLLETGTVESRGEGQLSPDGRWIAYESSESGRSEIYVQSFPALGGKTPVSAEGGETPRWSGSGRELFYRDPLKNQLMAVDVQTGSEFRAGHPRALFPLRSTDPGSGLFLPKQSWDVAPDGQRFLFIASPDNQESVVKLQAVVNWFEELRRRAPVEGK